MFLPEDFKSRMKAMLGDEYDAFEASYDDAPKKGLRVNTLRLTPNEFESITPFNVQNIPTSNGDKSEMFLLSQSEKTAGKHPLHSAGIYYIQEPSAMSTHHMLDGMSIEGKRILDMCAAPGGKTGAVAAVMNSKGLIVANEIVKNRSLELASNIERLGITNAVVLNAYPERIAQELAEYFDIVLVDAPCSGEGMFRKNPEAVKEWSKQHVVSCAQRQLAILKSAYKCVKSGGYILYSTCTFSYEENEGVTEAFASEYGFEILSSKRLYPHTSCGEGHFACLMQKQDGEHFAAARKQKTQKQHFTSCEDKAFAAFMKDTFTQVGTEHTAYITDSKRVVLATEEMLRVTEGLPYISIGVHAGDIRETGRSSYFEPSHTLFMAAELAKPRLMVRYSQDSDEVKAFLRGETQRSPFAEGESGYCMITVDGYPLGFCKVSEGMLKNKLPKGLRVL